MDPISTSASILTVLSAAGGTCKVLYNLIFELKDTSHDIRSQNRKLQCLNSTITCLLQVCKKLPKEFQLATHLQGVEEFAHDVSFIDAKIQKRRDSLGRGKIVRVRASCKWLLFDRHLRKFFDNLEHYNIIFSYALWAALLSLSMQIPAQTAAPQKICPEVSAKFNNRPDMASGVRIVDPPGHQYEAPNTDPTTFLNMKRLLARLPKSSERAGMLLQHRYAIGVGNVQLELRNGPAIIRRWSQRGHEIYTAEGYTLSTTIQSTWFIGRKSTICITILYHTAYALNFSIQFNLHFSTVVSLDNPAFKAVQAGDIEQVKQTISSGLLAVSATIPGGYTLLHCAARYGQIEIIYMLVKNGVDINITNDRGETPLHISVKQGRDHECTRHLLELGADPCQPDIEGRTVMHTFYNAVTAYMFKHHIEDIDTWAQDSKGMTILHYLSWSSRSAVQDLIRCTKPGMFSLNKCQSSVTSQLSIKDAQGKSVLHYAVQRGNLGLITFLLDRPDAVTLGMPDYLGCTLLHYATESSRTEAIDLFLYRGLDIDAADDKGRTVLHHACQWGNLKAVKHLLDLGFEHQLDVVVHDKRTPMQLAELYRSKAVVEYLRDIYSDQTVSDLDSEMKHVRVCTCKTSLSEGSTRYIGRISISTFLIFALLVHLAIVSLQGRG